MQDFRTCVEQLFLDTKQLQQKSFTSQDPTLPASDELQINFMFSCQPVFLEWISVPDSPQPEFLRRVDQPSTEKLIRINLQQLLTARRTIRRKLKCLPVRASVRRELSEFAVNKAWDVVESTPVEHNTVYLHFRMLMIHKHVFDESHATNSMEEDEEYLVPAVESSIESLESKRLTEAGTCSICLEDLVCGGEGVLMPCSHIFHGDCIKKWLRTSHYCPICRFEMPTS
ncbi:E3 ubiquitin-protein ligase RNF126-like [Sesamum indicum]|uniref:RING-type E3 ubiquitin transferase n=1 Tax=Sesamum indicum TaxID=4182 RepID=A0A6I9SNU0_SESIN|nr:E3 ubiquitin-protein ligase RNF126-like [Sesamum indicum]